MANLISKVDYTGMDSGSLQRYKMQIQNSKEMCERNIVKDKQQICELKRNVKLNEKLIIDANNELLKIEEALKHAHEVVYTPVIIVKKGKKDKYLGKNPPTYFLKSEWKECTVYYFEVYNVNVLGEDKGKHLIHTSIEYDSNAKTQLNTDLLRCIKQRGITKIYLEGGVKINTTILRKEVPSIEIQCSV